MSEGGKKENIPFILISYSFNFFVFDCYIYLTGIQMENLQKNEIANS